MRVRPAQAGSRARRRVVTLVSLLGLLGAAAILAWHAEWPWPEPPAAQPPPDPMPGQIVVDAAHPQWLRYAGGGPFFLCGPGDPEGFLYRGELRPDGTREGDQMALINKLKGTGANAIYLMAVRSHGGDGDRTQNPFLDHDPAKGLNPAVLEQWESWFRHMDTNGIVIFFFFYDDSARIWDTGHRMGPQERTFVRALVERFRHHRHLIWVVAEEYQERYSAARVRNIAAEIRAADPVGHPIAVHKLRGLDFSEFAEDPHIGQFAIQYTAESPDAFHDAMVTAWRRARGRYNLNLAEGHPDAFGEKARRRAWAAAMGGAYVMHLRWDIANTPVADLEDCGRLVRFMEATELVAMAPHDELAHAGTQYVLAQPGRSYIAYAANGPAPLGLKGLDAGRYDLTWFDPATGARVERSGLEVGAGDQAWARPAEIGDEAALHVRRSPP